MSGLLSSSAKCDWLLLPLSAVNQQACVAEKQLPRRHEAVNRCMLSHHSRCTAVSTKTQLQRLLCTAGPRKYYPKDADSKLAVLWLILVQPLLFGAIGIEIDFRQIQGSLIWKTVIILALGITQPQAVCREEPCLMYILMCEHNLRLTGLHSSQYCLHALLPHTLL